MRLLLFAKYFDDFINSCSFEDLYLLWFIISLVFIFLFLTFIIFLISLGVVNI